jgi:hypothetical protein
MKNRHCSTVFAFLGLGLAALSAAGCAADASGDLAPAEHTETTSAKLSATAPVSFVAVNLFTGGDDKRGDSRVWITINLTNGNSVTQETHDGYTWGNWTWSGFEYINLPSGTRNQDIANVVVSWAHGGNGWNGDNWNLQQLNIYALDASNNSWSYQGGPAGNPLLRFRGDDGSYVWPWVQ